MTYEKIMKQLKSFDFTDAQRKKLASIILKLDKEKQDILVSGDNIATINGQSLLNGGNISLIKTGIFTIVTELPTNDIDKDKVYLVPSTKTDNENKFSEYIYTDNGWEKLGTFTVEIDLSNYVQKTDVVTDTKDGLMLASDKVKLDAFEEANKYTKAVTLPNKILGTNGDAPILRVVSNKYSTTVSFLQYDFNKKTDSVVAADIPIASSIESGVMHSSDKVKLDSLVNYKAGNGINITGDTISCTLDTSLYSIVTELPETGLPNKIYLLPSTETEEGNIYTEYCYVDNKWEELGAYTPTVDLTPYRRALKLPNRILGTDNSDSLIEIFKAGENLNLRFRYKNSISGDQFSEYCIIPLVNNTTNGLISPSDKAKLDSQPTIKASNATGVTDNDYIVIKKSELNSILSRLSALENKA